MGWLQRLGLVSKVPSPPEAGILESVEEHLRSLPSHRVELVAAFAGLLGRVAYADDEISETEERRIQRHLVTDVGLTEAEANAAAAIVRSRLAVGGGDRHVLTRRYNEAASEDEKRRLIDALYAVATADDLVTHVEDREVRAIAAALMLPSSEVLSIRARYREKLEELQALRRLRGQAD